jgi:hypothetical protein
VLPGTEKAEFLEQLSHYQTRDAFLIRLLQAETCYSLIDVDDLDHITIRDNLTHKFSLKELPSSDWLL